MNLGIIKSDTVGVSFPKTFEVLPGITDKTVHVSKVQDIKKFYDDIDSLSKSNNKVIFTATVYNTDDGTYIAPVSIKMEFHQKAIRLFLWIL